MSLQRFIETGEIEITNDPENSMRRLAVLQNRMWWDPVLKQAGLNYMVYYLNEAGERVTGQRFIPYAWPLVADRKTKIDAEFNVVLHPGTAPEPLHGLIDPENPESGMEIINQAEIDAHGLALAAYEAANFEYDVMLNAVKTGANFFELQYNITLIRAQQNKADK